MRFRIFQTSCIGRVMEDSEGHYFLAAPPCEGAVLANKRKTEYEIEIESLEELVELAYLGENGLAVYPPIKETGGLPSLEIYNDYRE
jgi:hypothetical protein